MCQELGSGRKEKVRSTSCARETAAEAERCAWSLRLGKEEPTIQGDRRGCAVGRISGKMARKKQKRCAEKDEWQGRDKGWHRWDPLMGDVSMPCVGAWVLPRGCRRVGQKYGRPTKSLILIYFGCVMCGVPSYTYSRIAFCSFNPITFFMLLF